MKKISGILVTRLRFMGDIILSTPLLHALRRAFPDACIDYLAEHPFHQVLYHHPDVDTILSFKRQKGHSVVWPLLKKKYDVAIDLFGNPRSALLTRLSNAKIRIGGDFRIRRHFYTDPVKTSGRLNAIQFHLRYLRPLGIDPVIVSPFITVTDIEKEWARKFLCKLGINTEKPLIGIHPGASWPAKRWLPERFSRLADSLAENHNFEILFTMGPGETELVKSVKKNCRQRTYLTGVLSLRQLGAVLNALDVYVSNDCGPLHLAAATSCKTVGIFGPGEPDIWYPYDSAKGHRLVYNRIDCSHCHQDFCPRMDCMKSITVKQVEKATLDSLASEQP
ncbi:hypothetical protein GF407_03615 [candidate division KSB1 bacterium]|nr:hypothetical protein [candidate division KSB1 bacterium]